MKVGATRDGLVRWADDGALELLDLPQRDLCSLLTSSNDWREHVTEASVLRRLAPEDAVGASITDGGSSVWGIGLNYESRVLSTGRTPPACPVVFLRSSATGARPGGVVRLPETSSEVDFEGELAVIVGRTAYRIDASEAWEHIALIVPANDLTARDVMRQTRSPAIAKSFPGFGPLGWMAATPDTYDTPDDLELTTRVNAVVRQRDRTSGMLLSVPEVVALISAHAVLRPGDIVLTGSPAGAGDEDGVYLRAGDVVEVALADLPPLTSTIIGSSKRYDGDTEVGNGRRLESQNQGSTR